MKGVFKNKQGVILPTVLMIVVIIMIFGFSTLYLTSNHSKMTGNYIAREKALQYAEAGFNKYLWQLNDDVNFYSRPESDAMQNKPIKFNDGYYQLEVSKPNDAERYVTIKSTGWTAEFPDVKRTIEVQIRKKQFVHQVYVSHFEKNQKNNEPIYWTTGDEVHGPYHTNDILRIDGNPIFYDEVTLRDDKDYYRKSGNPDFKMGLPKGIGDLEFPATNSKLKDWAEKDGAVYYGRTTINLEGHKIRIRNGDGSRYEVIDIPPNKVIYIDGNESSDKWGLNTGNAFVSGTLEGQLTIAAKNNIYITYSDPTEWYDDRNVDINNSRIKPPNPPRTFEHSKSNYPYKENKSYPYEGGIKYTNTTFGDPDKPSVYDPENKIWVRKAEGTDMLGLVANNNVLILHYGWPRYPNPKNNRDTSPYWNYYWEWNSRSKRWEQIQEKNWWGQIQEIYDVAPHNINIHAAVFAVKGGFGYEAFDKDLSTKKGYITLWGNITQYNRLGVGYVSGVGYSKKYAHDRRMFYDYPPHILEPVNTGWEIKDWKEVN